jgi:nitric oxide reductase activation protein
MKKWMVGLIGMLLVTFVSGVVWAEDGEGEQKRKERPKQERRKGGRSGKDRGERMKAADKDQDGKITLEEFTAAHLERIKTMFERMDVNKDGVLSEEDRKAAREGREGAEAGKERKRGGAKHKNRKREGGETEE